MSFRSRKITTGKPTPKPSLADMLAAMQTELSAHDPSPVKPERVEGAAPSANAAPAADAAPRATAAPFEFSDDEFSDDDALPELGDAPVDREALKAVAREEQRQIDAGDTKAKVSSPLPSSLMRPGVAAAMERMAAAEAAIARQVDADMDALLSPTPTPATDASALEQEEAAAAGEAELEEHGPLEEAVARDPLLMPMKGALAVNRALGHQDGWGTESAVERYLAAKRESDAITSVLSEGNTGAEGSVAAALSPG